MIRKSLQAEIIDFENDPNGRYNLVNVLIENNMYTLANIYANNDLKTRNIFFSQISCEKH